MIECNIMICITVILKTLKRSFNAKSSWGPRAPETHAEWKAFKQEAKEERRKKTTSKLKHLWFSLSGGYRRGL